MLFFQGSLYLDLIRIVIDIAELSTYAEEVLKLKKRESSQAGKYNIFISICIMQWAVKYYGWFPFSFS